MLPLEVKITFMANLRLEDELHLPDDILLQVKIFSDVQESQFVTATGLKQIYVDVKIFLGPNYPDINFTSIDKCFPK